MKAKEAQDKSPIYSLLKLLGMVDICIYYKVQLFIGTVETKKVFEVVRGRFGSIVKGRVVYIGRDGNMVMYTEDLLSLELVGNREIPNALYFASFSHLKANEPGLMSELTI